MGLGWMYLGFAVVMAVIGLWAARRLDGRRKAMQAWAQQRGARFDANAVMEKVLLGLPQFSAVHAYNVIRLEREGTIVRVLDVGETCLCVVSTPGRNTPHLGLRPPSARETARRVTRAALRAEGREVRPELPTVSIDDDRDFMSAWLVESNEPATAHAFLSSRVREGLLRLREKKLIIECSGEHVAVSRDELTRPADFDDLITDALAVRRCWD